MASIPFTLAALATSAVPGLEVVGVSAYDNDPAFASAIITTDRGELIARVPRSETAEVRQSAELLGLAALTEGSRALLPFAVPQTLGMTRAGETRAVIATFTPGATFLADDLTEDALLVSSIAEVLAAIHDLPSSIAQQGGLPVRTSSDLNTQSRRLIERAEATRLIPQTVRERWIKLLDMPELWDFAPTMVHGSLDASQLRVDDDVIVSVEGWSEFGTGDPAIDFSWLIAAGSGAFQAVTSRYGELRSGGSLSSMKSRAQLYRELDIARWLLHGVESHKQEVVDDAVSMLDRLVDSVALTPAPDAARPALSDAEVEAMLEETPEVVDLLSDTAAYEALDEDRMFGVESAFLESDSNETSTTEAAPDTDTDTDVIIEAAISEIAEQPTVPIDDDELPRP